MGNKIFCILVVSILMVGCDWGAIKNKSIKISEILRKGKDKAKNQDSIELGENNSMSKNNISTVDVDVDVDVDIANLERSRVDFINHLKQVNDPVISNDNALISQAKGEIDLINNINFATIDSKPAKPAQNLGDSLSNATASGTEFLQIENQKEPSKRILPSKLEGLKSFINSFYEKEAFREAKATQSLIGDSNMGKEIAKLKKEYDQLNNLFWDMQQKFHNQKDSFIKNIKFRENREKNRVIFKSFSSIEKKIKNLNHKLNEIQSNFQIAYNSWNNATSLLKESIEKLILAIEKRHDNESRNQGQIVEPVSWRDKDQADTFAKDAKYNAEHSLSYLENAAAYFRYSLSDKKQAKRLLEEIQKEFYRIGIL
ncbi:hypothetical protein KJD10_05345 (plasmid) [Borreliella valaisiana]|uniref:hypothetical protein n=1 Tax=Borreliella valaisiana TaxID=62088 RepID=UPI0027380A50|nr:hypothetical protein [Borreliella valaisiana]WLN25835.1 hypothetical protein KJD10_05345 [Borreliella valaisiana]